MNEKEKEKIHIIFLFFFVFIVAFNANLTNLTQFGPAFPD